jgi:hypothetical protein
VQPSRVQQILYGRSLDAYVCADLIGKALVDKTATPVLVMVTDIESVLEIRQHLETPVAWLAPSGDPGAQAGAGAEIYEGSAERGPIHCHPRFPGDKKTISEMLARLGGKLDLSEPFVRIRDAISEARKMGVASNG